ncbi:hypothetical protein GSI_11164 [Ganoderma sinense ZZ0214-1]|uniref:CFEM domain-containing protein n=1 Tax=Ganoderma sinense ZZ0214-1 TaxID=1077348 RepID=A0A2G8RZ12_9APHY|nr:hypothetical protein GSI_11164 [Ganoderma sinense ZZ0214-1]
MKFSLIPAVAFLAASFAGVHAQNVSQCVLNCISQAATSNGCDLTNTQCLCTNSKLQQAALTCLQQSCTAQDLQNAESLVQTECSSYTSISFPPLSSTGSSGSGSGSGSSASATSPAASQTQSQSQSQSQSQNAAAHTKAKLGAAVVAVAVGAVVAL